MLIHARFLGSDFSGIPPDYFSFINEFVWHGQRGPRRPTVDRTHKGRAESHYRGNLNVIMFRDSQESLKEAAVALLYEWFENRSCMRHIILPQRQRFVAQLMKARDLALQKGKVVFGKGNV